MEDGVPRQGNHSHRFDLYGARTAFHQHIATLAEQLPAKAVLSYNLTSNRYNHLLIKHFLFQCGVYYIYKEW